ncbi:MAG: efflux transporter outer membrane subunit [Vicinamibacteria bacterium]
MLPAAAACAVGPRYHPPEMSMPKLWSEATGEPAAAGSDLARWWTGFHDRLLDSLVSRAVAGSPDLKIASARIREARAARGIAAAAALPELGAHAVYSRSERSEAVPPFQFAPAGAAPFGAREQDLFEAGFDASWEIDLFGGVRRDREASLAQVQATEEARRDVLVTLLADVVRNYLELRGTQQRIALLDETLRSQRDSLHLAQARFEAGLGTQLDVERAAGLVATTAARRPALERFARQSSYRLAVLIGLPPVALVPELERPGPLPTAPPELPAALPSELLSRRPDLRQAERELAAATARIGVARADLFPRFSILGGFGRRSEDAGDLGKGSSRFWGLVPGVRWPIFSGGRIRANIRVQDARAEQALYRYERAVLTALEEVENAISAHTREHRRREFLRASVASERRALELATERYTSGLESFLSVLDAQRSVYAAEDRLVQSDRNVGVGLVALYKSLGGGWSWSRRGLRETPMGRSGPARLPADRARE